VRFVLIEATAPDELLALAPDVRPGQEAAVSPAALGFLDRASHLLTRGYLVLFDYATGEDGTAQVHGYRGHRVEPDVLSAPGSRDITAGIDPSAVIRHAAANGLKAWGPITQRDALLNMGFGDLARAWRSRQGAALDEGRGRDAIGIYSARNRASLLVDPAGLGGFAVLCVGFGDVTRPDRLLDGSTDRLDPRGPDASDA
jgi:SAM-dependent MidA family methyltransferase